jgi:8-amino-7-oxononanoate synthase
MTNPDSRTSLLSSLEKQGLRRRLPPPVSTPGARVDRANRSFLQLSSNNYLGFSTHPTLIAAATKALQAHGCSATGSRLLSGNLSLHEELEGAVAHFKRTPAALLFNSGYAANLGILGSLAGPGDLLVSDKLNHASLIDGARASGAHTRWFRHKDLRRARELLAAHQKDYPDQTRWLVSDGVFSMDGDVVDLPALLEVARECRAGVILDDAHATGVLGDGGRGTFEHFNLAPDAREHGIPGLVIMGTFGKALGSAGAYAATDASTRDWLINRARSFIFSTALPPSVLAASLAALHLLQEDTTGIKLLRSRTRLFREALIKNGIAVTMDPTPIVPVLMGAADRALAVSTTLESKGILALAVRPPTVAPGTARIRCTVMATHSEKDLLYAAETLAAASKKENGNP